MLKSDKHRTAQMEESFNSLLEKMTNKHRRVLPVRVDLRFPQDYNHDGNNKEIQRFHKNLGQRFREKKITSIYYTVREQVNSENPHYHTMLLIDGDKVQSPHTVNSQCEEIWNDVLNHKGTGLVHFCKPKPNYNIPALEILHRPSSKANGDELVAQTKQFQEGKETTRQHAQYLHKPAGKGLAPHRTREVFISQMRKPKK